MHCERGDFPDRCVKMNWIKGQLYLQFVQIAIGIVVAYIVWQNGQRQIKSLDKKLDLLISWQHVNHELPIVEGGDDVIDVHDDPEQWT